MSRQTLLKGGTLLVHDKDDNVVPTKADLLIQGDRISRIHDGIQPSSEMEVIDCSRSVISPGFIDTHRHLWQTQLKGTQENLTLLEYFPTGNFSSYFFNPDDMFWGQLSGCFESIDAGTTTVVDHAHLTQSPEHVEQGLLATIASGIRCVFCYTPISRVKQWQPITFDQEILPPWVMETFHKYAKLYTEGTDVFSQHGRVKLGFGFDFLFLPSEVLQKLFESVRNAGAFLLTSHAVQGAMFDSGPGYGRHSAVQSYAQSKSLGPDVLFSHANHFAEEDAKLLQSSGAKISATPHTELQMGHGDPICLDKDFYHHSSLGVDCHCACSAYIPSQMSAVLQWHRAVQHAKLEAQGKWMKSLERTVQDVFNLGTILGARAIRMDDQIGSLKEGMKADLVIFDGSRPSMLAAAQRDPVAAIVLHSSIRDISTVIIDGQIRKQDGLLKPARVPNTVKDASQGEHDGRLVDWEETAKVVSESRAKIEKNFDDIVDVEKACQEVLTLFRMNKDAMVEWRK